MESLASELGGDVDFYSLAVQAELPEQWALVREHFRVGPRLPLLALFGEGRWQRSLQGPAPHEVVHPFITASLGFDADGNVL